MAETGRYPGPQTVTPAAFRWAVGAFITALIFCFGVLLDAHREYSKLRERIAVLEEANKNLEKSVSILRNYHVSQYKSGGTRNELYRQEQRALEAFQ